MFTNAHSVPSAQGGGLHGHLAILLTDANFIARIGVAFIHPGPPLAAIGTVSVALRADTDALADVTLYNNLCAALNSQILTAGNASLLSAVLSHLRNERGTMTPEELECNRAAVSEPWNLDKNPIENLCSKISNIQCVARLGAVPIPDITVITLTLAMIEKTGLLGSTTDKFCLQPTAEFTFKLFKTEFKMGNQEHIRRRVPWRSPRRHCHSTPRQRCSHCSTGYRVVSRPTRYH